MLNIVIIFLYTGGQHYWISEFTQQFFPLLLLFSQQSQNLREFAQVRISGMIFTTIEILSKVEFILERCFLWPHQIQDDFSGHTESRGRFCGCSKFWTIFLSFFFELCKPVTFFKNRVMFPLNHCAGPIIMSLTQFSLFSIEANVCTYFNGSEGK